MPVQEPKVYEFGDFRLEGRDHSLYAAASARPIALTPRAALLLYTLVCSEGRLLTKDELIDRVWAGALVEEGNLSQTIFVLRKALGDDSKNPRYIMTVPARGYQFIANVATAQPNQRLDIDSLQGFGRRRRVNIEAYRSFLEARAFWNKRTKEGLQAAVRLFERAIEHAPEFSAAYSGLADSHRLLADYYAAAIDRSDRHASATTNRQMAEAHTTLAYAKAFYDGDWGAAESSFLSALEHDPDYSTAHQWYGDYLTVLGRADEARRHFERAVTLAPGELMPAVGLASFFYIQRDGKRLIDQGRRVIEIDPRSGYGHFYLGFGYEFCGMEDEAVDTFAIAATKFGEPTEIGEELKAAYRQNGMAGVWHKRLEQYETRPHLKNYPRYLKSLVPVRLGDHETTLDWLGRAFDQHDRGIVYAAREPLLKPVRKDPRFREIIRRLGLS